VSFRGNGYTKTTRAEELAILRSADLTIQNGFKFFVFVDSRIDTESIAYTSPSRNSTSINASAYGGYVSGKATTRTYGGETTIINLPSAVNTVAMFKEKPAMAGMIYDAKFICESIGTKYKVICGEKK
jgi:hypothetical protein